jgi:3-deoxy-manno-octulosonate cytidylyltransferase (CMP-KDO synthetase)
MILHVLEKAQQAQIGPVVVACGEESLKAVVEGAGGRAILTDPHLPSGTDRVYAAMKQLKETSYDYIINLQGDLPNIAPSTIQSVFKCLVETKGDMATAAAPIEKTEEISSPHVVKIALTPQKGFQRALYFSRAPIPANEGVYYHHIGLYGFQRSALERFVSLPPSQLECRERLEQLRALEDGMNIYVTIVKEAPLSIDTPEDLEKCRILLSKM